MTDLKWIKFGDLEPPESTPCLVHFVTEDHKDVLFLAGRLGEDWYSLPEGALIFYDQPSMGQLMTPTHWAEASWPPDYPEHLKDWNALMK